MKSKYYDNLFKREWNLVHQIGPSVLTRYRILLKLIRKLKLKKNSKILDCGCGTGDFMSSLENKGYFVNGCDFSKESVLQSKKKVKSLVFHANLEEKHSLPKLKYDVIVCAEVLEHIKDDVSAMNNLNKALKKGGYLIISVPYLLKYWSPHDKFSGHFRRYEYHEMEGKLQKNGFDVIYSRAWGGLFFALYFKIIEDINPKTLMSNRNYNLKKLFSKLVFFTFYFDDLINSKRTGRRLYVIAKKK